MPLYAGTNPVSNLYYGDAQILALMQGRRQIWPDVRGAIPPLDIRIVEENGANGFEKWMEVGFYVPAALVGSAAAGWQTASGSHNIDLLRSENLTAWSTGDFVDCSGSPELIGGNYHYWSRSIYPVDSAISTGQIWCESTAYNADTRNNPFTSLIIAGVTQSLPNFPYTMPGDAAQLQTDILAAGWTGATVVASSATLWRIDIPDVPFDDYIQTTRVGWPVYYVADMYGNLVNPVDGLGFTGGFVNSADVRTKVPSQFPRAKVTPNP